MSVITPIDGISNKKFEPNLHHYLSFNSVFTLIRWMKFISIDFQGSNTDQIKKTRFIHEEMGRHLSDKKMMAVTLCKYIRIFFSDWDIHAERNVKKRNEKKVWLTRCSPESTSSREMRLCPSRRSSNRSPTCLLAWNRSHKHIKCMPFHKDVTQETRHATP